MPNINELNTFLTTGDVNEGDLITFKDAGTLESRDFSKAKDGSKEQIVLEIQIELPDGRIKTITPNATSRNALAKEFSEETANWKGKQGKITYIQQICFGELADVLVIVPVKSI